MATLWPVMATAGQPWRPFSLIKSHQPDEISCVKVSIAVERSLSVDRGRDSPGERSLLVDRGRDSAGERSLLVDKRRDSPGERSPRRRQRSSPGPPPVAIGSRQPPWGA